MDTFINALIKMNMRGIIIILVVLFVRFLLKKLRISHKYVIGLWAMVFLFFVFPWKLSLPVGFWNNANMPEEVRVITENTLRINEWQEDNDTAHMINPSAMDNHISAGVPVYPTEDNTGTVTTVPVEPAGQNAAGLNEVKEGSPKKPEIENVLGLLWIIGLSFLFGHMLYTYFLLKRKLRFSVLYQDNIRLAEDIDMPMVFGFIYPEIYLPISMETGNYTYVIAHEKMHIKRKDGLFKMLAYVVCLVHWFNPFIWIAYFLFGNDMEKACDEEVIRSMGKEKRQEYAYALLHMAAENGRKKKKIFVAPICFDEGNVKSRIRNIMKYKYTLPGIGTAVVIVILALSAIFMTEAKDAGQNGLEEDTVKAEGAGEDTTGENNDQNAGADIVSSEMTETLPGVRVSDLDALQVGDNFSLENYYITGRYTASNYYYIDEEGVLWGTGSNEFGQLGTGTYGTEEYYDEPVKIAEHVLSVDASGNDYFCIYLTEDGELYGIGLNYSGLLLGKGSESHVYSYLDFQKVTVPVLLMTDVAYARAGMECIVALKTDQTAYWWGQYAPATLTHANGVYDNYWKLEEDDTNPAKMLAVEPKKIMEHCKYITTGTFTGAAISESEELYTWGFNAFGQCGTPVTEDDFVRTPVKVMDNTKMVWLDRIVFSESLSQTSTYMRWETEYIYNTFVLTTGDALLAAGVDMGDKEKITELNGDLVETQTHRYSDSFVPVRAVEYSINNMLKTLSELEFGMSVEEAEEILNSAGLRTFRVDESVYDEGYDTGLCALYNQYHCYFDSQDELVKITIQEGGSRDGRFALEMSLSDLKRVIEEAGGAITKVESDTPYDIWSFQDQLIQYEFLVYEGRVSVVNEIVIKEDLRISDEIDEWRRKKQIALEHNNLFEDGMDGFLMDLNRALSVPSELYTANKLRITFDGDGVIQTLYAFLYGKDDKGETRTYLVDYDRSASKNMTVWLDGYANGTYEAGKRLEPMFVILQNAGIEDQIARWQGNSVDGIYTVEYVGTRTFQTVEDLQYLPGDVDGDGLQSGISDLAALRSGGSVDGFTVTLSRLNTAERTSIYYIMEPEYTSLQEIMKEAEMQQTEAAKAAEGWMVDQADGTMYFFLDEQTGWRLVVADAAAGSRFYVLEKTEDGGSSWDHINANPFESAGGVAEGLIFYDEDFGYAGLSGASQSYSQLYVTHDGGHNFEKVMLPMDTVTELPELGQSLGLSSADYDYYEMPEQAGEDLFIMAITQNGEKSGLLFKSEDRGTTWIFCPNE